MPIFTSKDKDKNRSVNFMAVDGLPEYQLGDAINEISNSSKDR